MTELETAEVMRGPTVSPNHTLMWRLRISSIWRVGSKRLCAFAWGFVSECQRCAERIGDLGAVAALLV